MFSIYLRVKTPDLVTPDITCDSRCSNVCATAESLALGVVLPSAEPSSETVRTSFERRGASCTRASCRCQCRARQPIVFRHCVRTSLRLVSVSYRVSRTRCRGDTSSATLHLRRRRETCWRTAIEIIALCTPPRRRPQRECAQCTMQ